MTSPQLLRDDYLGPEMTTPPEGWHTAWDLRPPKPDDPAYPEYRRLIPAMIAYNQALIDRSDAAPRIEATPYSNGHEYIAPDWSPPPLEEGDPGPEPDIIDLAERRDRKAKLGVRILRIEATSGAAVVTPPAPRHRRASAHPYPTFDEIWEHHIVPLAGRVLRRGDGSSNTVLAVDWAGLTRFTSGGNRQVIPVEIFRYAIETVLTRGSITRDEINQHYPGRASSGIVLVLGQVPLFEVGGRPTVVRMRRTV